MSVYDTYQECRLVANRMLSIKLPLKFPFFSRFVLVTSLPPFFTRMPTMTMKLWVARLARVMTYRIVLAMHSVTSSAWIARIVSPSWCRNRLRRLLFIWVFTSQAESPCHYLFYLDQKRWNIDCKIAGQKSYSWRWERAGGELRRVYNAWQDCVLISFFYDVVSRLISLAF